MPVWVWIALTSLYEILCIFMVEQILWISSQNEQQKNVKSFILMFHLCFEWKLSQTQCKSRNSVTVLKCKFSPGVPHILPSFMTYKLLYIYQQKPLHWRILTHFCGTASRFPTYIESKAPAFFWQMYYMWW